METGVAKQRGYCALYQLECFQLVRLHASRTVVTAEPWTHKYMVLKPGMSWSDPTGGGCLCDCDTRTHGVLSEGS